MEKQNPLQILGTRLDNLIEYLDNFSPLAKLIREAEPYVENSGKYAQFLQNPIFFNQDGSVKIEYRTQLNNLQKSTKDSKINSVLWKVNTMQEAVSLLGISGEINKEQKEIRDYLNFLKMYVEAAISDPPVYILSTEELNTDIKNKATIQLIDNKRKIRELLGHSKDKMLEYGEICRFQTVKQVYKRRTLEGEFRRSLERLLNLEIDDEKSSFEQKVLNGEERAIFLALVICEDYYEREILPKLRPAKA